MHYKKMIAIVMAMVFLILIEGCTDLDQTIYHPDISQGNYFSYEEISKIRTGMNKHQVIHILGTPMMTDPFGTNTWFYIFRYQSYRNKTIQRTLILTFNNKDTLSFIKTCNATGN